VEKRLERIARRLLNFTQDAKLDWQAESGYGGAFRAQAGNGSVQVSSYLLMSERGCSLDFYNERDEVAESVRATDHSDPEGYRLLADLYELARRHAHRTDDTLRKLEDDLGL
jgi:hypothetical protein